MSVAMSTGTTNISDLPISSQVNNENNVVLEMTENAKVANPMQQLQEERQNIVMAPQNTIQNSSNLPPNVSMETAQPMQNSNSLENNPNGAAILEQKQLNQFVTGIQQASAAGATQLPSRDIPRETVQIVNDEQIQPNFIPQPPEDYITKHETQEDLMTNAVNNEKQMNTMERIYEEVQVPLLITILYFLFQLPFLKKNLGKILPSFFGQDGNYNLSGNLFTCFLFGIIYFCISKGMSYLSKM
jgi:hypothetical protein